MSAIHASPDLYPAGTDFSLYVLQKCALDGVVAASYFIKSRDRENQRSGRTYRQLQIPARVTHKHTPYPPPSINRKTNNNFLTKLRSTNEKYPSSGKRSLLSQSGPHGRGPGTRLPEDLVLQSGLGSSFEVFTTRREEEGATA